MKGSFPVATFIAHASAFVPAAPFKAAEWAAGGTLVFTKRADYIHIPSQSNPDTDIAVQYGTPVATITRTNRSNE